MLLLSLSNCDSRKRTFLCVLGRRVFVFRRHRGELDARKEGKAIMGLSTEEQALFEAIQQARTSKTPIPSQGEWWRVYLAGAYRIQTALGSSQPLKGYKLGLLSAAKQEQMGLTTPIWGRVHPNMLLDGSVPLNRFLQPRLEP